jgi:CRP/FNR family cyclic AMP-dependent transcriptional regulator
VSSLLFDLLEQPDFKEGTHWRKQRYAANTPVFSEGETGRELYLVLEGRLRVIGKIDLDAERQIHPGFSELTEGDVFGELVLFDEQNRSATVMTLSEVELAVIDGNNLLEFLDQHPDIGYPILKQLMTVLVGRLRKANQRIFSLFAWGLKSKGLDTLL